MIQANYTTIAEHLQDISDPRQPRGQSYEWQLLLIVASAVIAGQHSVRGMAQWATEEAPEVCLNACCLSPFAATAQGFELKLVLFVLALSISRLPI